MFSGGNGKFDYPMDIAVDNNGYVYVTEYLNHRVQKFTSKYTSYI